MRRGYNARPAGRRIQASELELQGRTISSAEGLPPLLLLGGGSRTNKSKAWGAGCRKKKGGLQRVIGSRSPHRNVPNTHLDLKPVHPARLKQDISIIGLNFTSVILPSDVWSNRKVGTTLMGLLVRRTSLFLALLLQRPQVTFLSVVLGHAIGRHERVFSHRGSNTCAEVGRCRVSCHLSLRL